jgi:hypothetical protein
MSHKRLTEAQLDAYADEHIGYETQMVVACAIELADRRSHTPLVHEPTVDDALIEATLVHLRLLNAFLVGSGDSREAKAEHWVPWREDFLSTGERRRINEQVAHLSVNRQARLQWDLAGMTYRCCLALNRFLQSVANQRPGRSAGLARVQEHVTLGMSRLAPAVAGQGLVATGAAGPQPRAVSR